MSGFEVVASAVRTAGTQMKAASDGITKADPSSDITKVGTAMSGSRSAAQAATLSSTWASRFKTWSTDANTQATALKTAADEYDAADHAANEKLRVQMRRTGETVA